MQKPPVPPKCYDIFKKRKKKNLTWHLATFGKNIFLKVKFKTEIKIA